MGAVIGGQNLLKGRRKALAEAARDLGPDQLKRVEELLKSWSDENRAELTKLLGPDRAKRLLRDLGIV